MPPLFVMEALKQLANRLLKLDQKTILFKAVANNPKLQRLAEELNREQLQKGERADGTKLPDYSKTSVDVFGKEPGAMTLEDTGEFYESFNVVLLDDGFVIDADEIKTDEATGDQTNLFTKYGESITGLNDENLSKFVIELLPKVQEAILKIVLQ